MAHALIEGPSGPLYIEAANRGVRRLDFVGLADFWPEDLADTSGSAGSGTIEEAQRQLSEYFGGARCVFDLPLDLTGTPFQLRVWRAIAAIPFGATLSYAEVALAAGAPSAYRAAGSACRLNPTAILVPCHRVIGSDGGLHGYGGGLDTKSWLLQHERSLPGGDV